MILAFRCKSIMSINTANVCITIAGFAAGKFTDSISKFVNRHVDEENSLLQSLNIAREYLPADVVIPSLQIGASMCITGEFPAGAALYALGPYISFALARFMQVGNRFMRASAFASSAPLPEPRCSSERIRASKRVFRSHRKVEIGAETILLLMSHMDRTSLQTPAVLVVAAST